ncbi:PREDICTED: carcinoembryonic antigen-related cell adhesion molecule 8-like [Cyprinodon variegatus]|uniref:carcinoembryonic antigen-related cell adhesion molecule 8-like n=1 Tax=Cyprinodon variegatus TaxID=28743 RepID=UPI00074267DD|nr:PREDICTED: carcinoembryonic antigen-related cell adhesion molecule 8-like [Cyprinodon variegatus]
MLDTYEPVSNVVVTPQNLELIEFHRPGSLSCSSSGSSLTFAWMNGSSQITAGGGLQITDGGSTLTFSGISRYHHGTYRCRVSNPVSSGISDPVSVFVSCE